jgi:hypothetical protein
MAQERLHHLVRTPLLSSLADITLTAKQYRNAVFGGNI